MREKTSGTNASAFLQEGSSEGSELFSLSDAGNTWNFFRRQKPQKNNVSFSNLPQEALPLNSLLLGPQETGGPSLYFHTQVGNCPRNSLSWHGRESKCRGEYSCLDRTSLHFLPYFTIYVIGKKIEVNVTAQRLQDVLLHLSSYAGKWLTQNIWWSETIMFFFIFHISSWGKHFNPATHT